MEVTVVSIKTIKERIPENPIEAYSPRAVVRGFDNPRYPQIKHSIYISKEKLTNSINSFLLFSFLNNRVPPQLPFVNITNKYSIYVEITLNKKRVNKKVIVGLFTRAL